VIKKQISGLSVVIFLLVTLILSGESPNAEASPAISKKNAGKVEGFRLALFGMTEKQVYRAIYKEFRISKKTVERQVHPIEKTVNLGILVEDLLPQSGPARIYYVFGYKSRRLIQVNIIWGRPATEKPDAEQVVALANQLRDHFSEQGFRQKGLVVNQSFGKDSILVFRGTDDKGRVVLLLLVNPQKPGVPENQEIILKLSYIQQPDHPDIFTIGKGKF
jgi:hypothetical protein